MKDILSKLAGKLGVVGQEVSITIGNRAEINNVLKRSYRRLDRLEAKLERAKERRQPIKDIKRAIKKYHVQIKMIETILDIQDESIE